MKPQTTPEQQYQAATGPLATNSRVNPHSVGQPNTTRCEGGSNGQPTSGLSSDRRVVTTKLVSQSQTTRSVEEIAFAIALSTIIPKDRRNMVWERDWSDREMREYENQARYLKRRLKL